MDEKDLPFPECTREIGRNFIVQQCKAMGLNPAAHVMRFDIECSQRNAEAIFKNYQARHVLTKA